MDEECTGRQRDRRLPLVLKKNKYFCAGLHFLLAVSPRSQFPHYVFPPQEMETPQASMAARGLSKGRVHQI